MRNTPLKRGGRLPKVGKRGKRMKSEHKAFKEGIREKCRVGPNAYQCERCGRDVTLEFFEAHHRLPRGRGGSNLLHNGAGLCSGPGGCHSLVHGHHVPDYANWIEPTKAQDKK